MTENTTPKILKCQEGEARTVPDERSVMRTTPGALLTMTDGSIWFHPYNGEAPVKIEGANP